MTTKEFLACEADSLKKMKRYQLPNYFKKIGTTLAIGCLILVLINKPLWDSEMVRMGGKLGMLIGLLIVSISKEKIEDELITQLRMQSYTFAFIWGVLYALFQPFINFMVGRLVEGEATTFELLGDFQILWFLLAIQVMYFAVLKRRHQ